MGPTKLKRKSNRSNVCKHTSPFPVYWIQWLLVFDIFVDSSAPKFANLTWTKYRSLEGNINEDLFWIFLKIRPVDKNPIAEAV